MFRWVGSGEVLYRVALLEYEFVPPPPLPLLHAMPSDCFFNREVVYVGYLYCCWACFTLVFVSDAMLYFITPHFAMSTINIVVLIAESMNELTYGLFLNKRLDVISVRVIRHTVVCGTGNRCST